MAFALEQYRSIAMQDVRIGIIGCGGRARILATDLRRRHPELRIVALADVNPASIEAARSGPAPLARVYDDYRELCGARDIDWVMVGSFNAFHCEHAVAALNARKHVFCEKPLATTVEDCVAMRQAVLKNGTIFSLGLTLRYATLYRRIHRLISEGAIGKLMSFEFNENLDFNHGGFIHADWRRHTKFAGSHALEKCCHDIDLANWFAGGLAQRVASFGGTNFFLPENAHHMDRIGNDEYGKRAYCSWLGQDASPFTNDKDIVDNQVAIIEYQNGVRATFHTNCNAGIPERRMLLYGTEGAIRADLLTGSLEHRRIGWSKSTVVYRETGGGHGNGDTFLVDNLAASMQSGELPEAGIYEGVTSAITCFGIDEAQATNQCVEMAPLWEGAGL